MTPSGTVLLFRFLICASRTQGELKKTEAEIPPAQVNLWTSYQPKTTLQGQLTVIIRYFLEGNATRPSPSTVFLQSFAIFNLYLAPYAQTY